MKTFPKLYARGSAGQVLEWTITAKNDYYFTVSGQVDGKKVTSAPNECEPKNVGKKNEISAEAQALKEAEAKWKKKIKEGYKQDVKDIDISTFFEPMLAKSYADYQDDITWPVYIQPKFNGIRCIATKHGLFSRKGEQFFCIEHIRETLAPIFERDPDAILDGELFNPKVRLNEISHLVSVNRNEKDVTEDDLNAARAKVEYHVYDTGKLFEVTLATPYRQRLAAIQKYLDGIQFVYVAPTVLVHDHKAVKKALSVTRKNKEEGVIIRNPEAPYTNGRTRDLLKYKNFFSAEYRVKSIKPGTGNWAKCAKIIECELPDGTTFNTNIRGTRAELEDLLTNAFKHLGKFATVEYGELSVYGVPLTPYTQLPFRDYE